LGTANDRDLARQLHRSVKLVRKKRRTLNSAAPFRRSWNSAEERLIGKFSDTEVARRLNRTVMAVALHRQRLGLALGDRS